MMEREKVWRLVTTHLQTDYLLKHLIATEACMKALAIKLGEDEAMWGTAGLIHDLDLDEVKADPERHGKEGARILRDEGYPDEIINAVLAHAAHKEPETMLEKAICAVDPTTGFIVAATLVRQDKKISGLEVKSIRKRMNEKRFAANVDRKKIMAAEDLGMEVNDFLALCLEAMKQVSPDLGL
ncbi:MAG: HDIG domain-containing metalloprotein [Pseudomonadota bacterium]